MALTRATQMRQIIDSKQEELNQKSLQRRLCMSDISDMDDDGDGEIDHWYACSLAGSNGCTCPTTVSNVPLDPPRARLPTAASIRRV